MFFSGFKRPAFSRNLLSWFKRPFLHLPACMLDRLSPLSPFIPSTAHKRFGHRQPGNRPVPHLPPSCIPPSTALPCCLKPGSQKVRPLWSQLLASAEHAVFEAFLPSSVHNLNQCTVFQSLQASPIHLLLTDFQTAEMSTIGKEAMVCEWTPLPDTAEKGFWPFI